MRQLLREADFDQEATASGPYPVLAALSHCYPEHRGRLPTCYSPVRRCTNRVAPVFPHDLHVLGTPPAFVLSQDQTLQLKFHADRSFPIHEFSQRSKTILITRHFHHRLRRKKPKEDNGRSALPSSFQRPTALGGSVLIFKRTERVNPPDNTPSKFV